MRTLYLVRHGRAAPREDYRRDADRPLTEDGARQTAQCGRGFARLARPTLILTSPLLRARQTAELFAKALEPPPPVRTLDELAAVEDIPALLETINAARADAVALVGHQPDMGRLASYLLTGQQTVQLDFQKAAACRIDVDSKGGRGAGLLIWLVPPKVLRAMGK